VLAAGKSLHAALEQLVIRTPDGVPAWEDILRVDAVLPATPFGGRYEKTAEPLGPGGAALAALLTAP
jgi:hypothetical protein